MEIGTLYADLGDAVHDTLPMHCTSSSSSYHGLERDPGFRTTISTQIFGRQTNLQNGDVIQLKSWSSMPPPLAATVLNMLASGAPQAVVLATVARSWHQHILDNRKFQELFECQARTLVAVLKANHLQAITSNSAPYCVSAFMKMWLDLQFPAVVPYSAWRVNAQQPVGQYVDGRTVYVDVKRRLASKDCVFQTALTLNRLSQWMNNEETMIDKVNAVTVLFLVPQGLFWLALYSDGYVHWGDIVGRICGLGACFGGASCTTCAVVCQARILYLKHKLRRQLEIHHHHQTPVAGQDIRALSLLRDRCEALNLFRCACWACVILVSTWWLLLKASAEQILVAFAVLSTLLSVVAVAMWLALQKSMAHFPSLFKLWFVHQWSMTPFFSALAVAQFLMSEWWKLAFVILAALAPASVLFGDVVLLVHGKPLHQTTADEIFGTAAMLGILLVALGGLSILCGRCVKATWAIAVPLTIVALPAQLPLLVVALTFVTECSFRSVRRARVLSSSCFKRFFNVLSWPIIARNGKGSSTIPPGNTEMP